MNNGDPEHLVSAADEYQAQAVVRVLIERGDQVTMWGDQRHDPTYWLAIMGKQVGQLGSSILDFKWSADSDVKAHNRDRMYREAAQVTAVGLAMMEAILKNTMLDEVSSVKPDRRRLATLLDRVGPDYTKDEHHFDDPETEYSDAAD